MGPETHADQSIELQQQLDSERRRSQSLEERVRDLDSLRKEGERKIEEADRNNQVRSKLQELGVRKVDLAMKIVQDDVDRGEDGFLYGRGPGGAVGLDSYLKSFVAENPEFLPPRISGGSGAVSADRDGIRTSGIQLESIKPGMTEEKSRRAWNEVARLLGSGLTED